METPVSLLERLQCAPDSASWKRLVELYTPWLQGWLRQYGLQSADVDDLVQEVLAAVNKELAGFRREARPGSFRSWLRAIARNRLRDFWRARRRQRAGETVSDLEDQTANLDRLWDEEHDRYVARRLLELIESEFEPGTVQAFRRLVLDGRRGDEVAKELGNSVNAVYIAKSRVLARLRQEIGGLIEG
jgi:RNA polymerase sigma-70 factor (ECF subfamily)